MIPYGHQSVDAADIKAVVAALKSDRLTTGPLVDRFEEAVSSYAGCTYGAAVSSGTAALHCAMHAAGIGPGDEVIVPTLTFAATSNAVLYEGGTPVFADVNPGTLLIDPVSVESKITSRTKAIVTVDYAGQPCEYDSLRKISDKFGLILMEDAAHALGAEYKRKRVGKLADMTIFSFHPVKHITTGEGGMVVTDNQDFDHRIRMFRNHGIDLDYQARDKAGTWFYSITDLGYNYRLTDIQCALGLSQLRKLPRWLEKRRAIARVYDEYFEKENGMVPLTVKPYVYHAYHLYVVELNPARVSASRDDIFAELRARGIGVNVHYIPVHLHPLYRKRFGYGLGMCPVAEAAYERILSLPMFPSLTDNQLRRILQVMNTVLRKHEK